MNYIKGILTLFVLVPLVTIAQYLDEFPTNTNTLLWKIEGKSVKKDSYIFGTIHLIKKDNYYFPEEIQSLVLNAEQITLEIGEINQQEIMESLFLKKGRLIEFFTPEQGDSLFMWAKQNMGMEKEQFLMSFNQMKPFVLVQLMNNAGKDSIEVESYDMNIMRMGVESKIPVFGLETISQQMALFDDMDTLSIRKMIMAGITQPEVALNKMNELVETYLKNNVDELYSLTTEEDSEMKDFMFEFIDQRNINWIPQIEKMIKKKKTFIAVGAAHLGGQNGVLRLLERKGYKLIPILF